MVLISAVRPGNPDAIRAWPSWGINRLSFLQILVLAVVQGLTEFLPVSSSGHLILVPQLTGWPDQGLAIDVATHVGTLFAVLIYFWRDIGRMAAGPAAASARQARPLARTWCSIC